MGNYVKVFFVTNRKNRDVAKHIVLFIENLHSPAGTERIASDVANSLCQIGMDVSFVVLSAPAGSYYELNNRIHVFSLNTPFNSRIQAAIKLRRLLKRESPDFLVNVGVSIGQISLLAAWGLKTKIIGWEHFNLNAGSKLGYYWRLLAAKLCYKTVVLTQKDRIDYLEKVDADVVCIPNFITRFIDSKSQLDSKIVLSIGRLTYQKGYDLLLQAWQKVIKQMPDWKLQIVGSGSDERELKLQAVALDVLESVSFTPATNNVVPYYSQASLYVMSSRFEGMPMVLLEAKMHGLPCVSFNCPNGPNEIIDHLVDGLLVEPNNVESLAKAMLALMEDRGKLKEFGDRAKEGALQRFTKEVAVEKWCALFS